MAPPLPRCRTLTLAPHFGRPAQALEAALSEARQEAAGLAQLREQLAAAAEREAASRVPMMQAGTAAVLLPLVQLAYFGLRVVLWLAAAMSRLGFR